MLLVHCFGNLTLQGNERQMIILGMDGYLIFYVNTGKQLNSVSVQTVYFRLNHHIHVRRGRLTSSYL